MGLWGFFYLKSFPFSLESLYPYPLFLEKILCAFALSWIWSSYLSSLCLYFFCYWWCLSFFVMVMLPFNRGWQISVLSFFLYQIIFHPAYLSVLWSYFYFFFCLLLLPLSVLFYPIFFSAFSFNCWVLSLVLVVFVKWVLQFSLSSLKNNALMCCIYPRIVYICIAKWF